MEDRCFEGGVRSYIEISVSGLNFVTISLGACDVLKECTRKKMLRSFKDFF